MSLEYRRLDYDGEPLNEATMDPNPIALFRRWLEVAVGAKVKEPWAMTLATCDTKCMPSARVVLLRDVDDRGFVFFTNYDSRKGVELESNPHAALVFFWPELERQVRVEGTVTHTSEAQSDAYFAGRPEGSRIGAWASPQSRVLPSRKWLEDRVAEEKLKNAGNGIPRPPVWGGYRVAPDVVEFWQGQPSRLHDRIRYRLQSSGIWLVDRLAP